MKRYTKRLTALVLALVLTVGTAGQTALASWALGTELVDRTVELAEGVSWTAQSLWSASKSDLRTENYITYTPGSKVTPMIYSGAYVASWKTMMSAAADLEGQGCRVIAGINGGFFNSDSTIVGMLMTEGVVRSLDLNNLTMLGFTWDGQVFIDESGRTMTKTVSWGSSRYNLVGFNACRSIYDPGGLYLYNQEFYSKVNYDADRGCVAVVLSPVSGGGETKDDAQTPEPDDGETGDDVQTPEPGDGETGDDVQLPEASDGETGDDVQTPEASDGETGDGVQTPETGDGETGDDPQTTEPNRGVTMNGTLTLSVESIMDTGAGDTFNGYLTDGRYMLYASYYNGNDALLNALRSLTPGQQVTVTVSGVSEQWADAAYGISGMYTLLRDGEIVSGLPSGANPYTAVGIKKDGTAVFYTIDGRQNGYSVGATYAQVAQRLQELDCVTAVALDGGGSTTLGATLPGQQNFELLNQPSQTGRKLNNSIFLVAGDGYAGMDPGFYLSSDTQVVFTGASLNVSAAAYDQWGEATSGETPDWSATGGTVEGDGLTAVYTAGSTDGTYTISAGSGAELPVRVVSELSQLTVAGEDGAPMSSLLIQVRDTVALSASGKWKNLDVAIGNEDVTWTVSGGIGTIDAQGRFKAGSTNASGEITASAGGRTVTISVTVEKNHPFSDIEGHWSEDYAIRLYELGLTEGRDLTDGTVGFQPNAELTRGELIVFIARLLHVDTEKYQDVELPFEDADSIPQWALSEAKAMYDLSVLDGGESGGKLYANAKSSISRQEAMTMLGRVLVEQVSQDLSGFSDSELVSDWARIYVETLVALNIVEGNDGMLSPKSSITRGEIAKLLVEINDLEKAELTSRPSAPEGGEPDGPDGPDQPEETAGGSAAPDGPFLGGMN